MLAAKACCGLVTKQAKALNGSHKSVATMAGFEGALLGMGNPLLDIISDVDQAFLDKYKVSDALNQFPATLQTTCLFSKTRSLCAFASPPSSVEPRSPILQRSIAQLPRHG